MFVGVSWLIFSLSSGRELGKKEEAKKRHVRQILYDFTRNHKAWSRMFVPKSRSGRKKEKCWKTE